MKEFSTRDISEFKRTAQNVWPDMAKKLRLEEKISLLNKELESIERKIALKEAYVLNTTGYHVFELIDRKVTKTPALDENGAIKLDDKGKSVILTNVEFTLKYPETVVPVYSNTPDAPSEEYDQAQDKAADSEETL